MIRFLGFKIVRINYASFCQLSGITRFPLVNADPENQNCCELQNTAAVHINTCDLRIRLK